ncbi:MAG: hypothetical protein DRJ42_07280 [Deltaproteobacteria bacterium]|nr:MAG: hypothetical protein DRJ42_07280 [Deltaproteobacteria bacterium]
MSPLRPVAPAVLPMLLLLPLLLTGLWSCSDEPISMTVDVVSDWRPGGDFTRVESTLVRGESLEREEREVRQVTFPVAGAEDFLGGVRVAELLDVSGGPLTLEVTLISAAGAPVASRRLSLDLDRDFAATVLLTRSCRDVECPAPSGAPELSECQGGTCVDPRCSLSTPEYCPPPMCDSDAECGAPIPSCMTTGVCNRGYCVCSESTPPVPDSGPPPDSAPPPDCRIDADCGAPSAGPWSPCEGFADVCVETGGTHSREVTTPTCTSGSCTFPSSPESEACVRDTDGSSCNDSNACTTGDACAGGSCTGAPVSCDDTNPCTADSCVPATGCTNTPMAEHASCGASYERCCGGACIDTRSSTSHCGGCGINCAAGFACVNYSGRTVCECTGNAHCPGGAQHICSPTYDLHCGCRDSTVCPSPMTCVDIAGALNYCTY